MDLARWHNCTLDASLVAEELDVSMELMHPHRKKFNISSLSNGFPSVAFSGWLNAVFRTSVLLNYPPSSGLLHCYDMIMSIYLRPNQNSIIFLIQPWHLNQPAHSDR